MSSYLCFYGRNKKKEKTFGFGLMSQESVLTPNGPMSVYAVTEGCKVMGTDGRAHTVKSVKSFQLNTVCNVQFDDGSNVQCGLDHVWKVVNENGHKQELTCEEIYRDGCDKYYALGCDELQFDEKPIDGSVEDFIESLLVKEPNDRFIPHNLLYNSVDVRRKLLDGLMDKLRDDSKENTMITDSQFLFRDIVSIFMSLGHIAPNTYISADNSENKPMYVIDYGKCLGRSRERAMRLQRRIKSIEISDMRYLTEFYDIKVDSEDGMFIAGNFLAVCGDNESMYRCSDDKPHEIISFSRNSEVYSYFNENLNIPYSYNSEKYLTLSESDVDRVEDDIKKDIENTKKRIAEYEKHAASNQEYIEEILSSKEYLDELVQALHYTEFINLLVIETSYDGSFNEILVKIS